MYFSQLFSSKAYFKMCFEVQKFEIIDFHINHYYYVLSYLMIGLTCDLLDMCAVFKQ